MEKFYRLLAISVWSLGDRARLELQIWGERSSVLGSHGVTRKRNIPHTFTSNAFNSLPEALLYPCQTFHACISHYGSNKSEKKKKEKKNYTGKIGFCL